jgi:hypothetical protein
MFPFVASLPPSLVPMVAILIDEGYVFKEFHDIFSKDLAN